jgi:hypothetical protein
VDGDQFGLHARCRARPQPVTFDRTHPFFRNDQARDNNGQATYRVPDATNPNLQPWVKQELEKQRAKVLAGEIGQTPRWSCKPGGVPGFSLFVVEPVYIVQGPKKVLLIYQGNQEVRHIYLNTQHTQNPTPSWYGESIGWYEGDELVVDTIGLSPKAVIDNYQTPHTDKLHVVERYRVDGSRQGARSQSDGRRPGRVQCAVESKTALQPHRARSLTRSQMLGEQCRPLRPEGIRRLADRGQAGFLSSTQSETRALPHRWLKKNARYGIAAALLGGAALAPAFSADEGARTAIPNFATDAKIGWQLTDDDFLLPDGGGPGPVVSDPRYPYISFYRYPTNPAAHIRVADLNNVILQPSTKAALEKANQRSLSGQVIAIPKERCWPVGVPAFLLYPATPVYFLQTPKEVLMVWMQDHQVRRVRLNEQHSPNERSQWFGDFHRSLRRRHAGRRHDRALAPHLYRQLLHPAQRTAPRCRALPHDRGRPHAGGEGSRRGPPSLHDPVERGAGLPADGERPHARNRLCREQRRPFRPRYRPHADSRKTRLLRRRAVPEF